MQKTPIFIRIAVIAFVCALLAVAAICGLRVHDLSNDQKEIKEDYSIVNNISYGILSISKWRDLVVEAVTHRIDHFNFTKAEQDSLEKEVQGILNTVIDKADSMINAPQKTLSGKLRKLAFRTFIDKKALHEQVPAYAHSIMAQVTKRSSKRKLMFVAKSKLEDLGQETYDSSVNVEQHTVDSVYQKYAVKDPDAFDKVTGDKLARIKHEMYTNALVMLAGPLILLLLWYFLWKRSDLYIPLFILSILMGLVLLLVGLTSTMIEIDARINSLDFHLIGETISFKNQVLFFQSKSILNVVTLLMRTGKYDSILVGVLILVFSIVFPLTKLLCGGLYVLNPTVHRKNKIVSYFAFHSGKWSMADVMVVAIFMSYIGFNGILNDQMAGLNMKSESFTTIATNQTSLQPGYIVFVGFVIFGLLLSEILKRITKVEEPKQDTQ